MRQFTTRDHDLLAVERFRDDTQHMVEFEVLKDDNLIALREETARLFLSEQDYQRILRSQERKEIRITYHAPVVEGHIIKPKKKKHRLLTMGRILYVRYGPFESGDYQFVSRPHGRAHAGGNPAVPGRH